MSAVQGEWPMLMDRWCARNTEMNNDKGMEISPPAIPARMERPVNFNALQPRKMHLPIPGYGTSNGFPHRGQSQVVLASSMTALNFALHSRQMNLNLYGFMRLVRVLKQNQPPWFPKVAGEFRTRNETSAGAFSRPRGGDLDMRHRLPDLSAWRRRFLGQRLTARYEVLKPRSGSLRTV
jgi:hypothetical protein